MTEANISTQIACRVCGESKNIEHFPKSKTGKYGSTTRCKPCTAMYLKEYQLANKEKLKAKQSEWYFQNRDKNIEARKVDYEKNKQRYKDRAREWAVANPEKRKKAIKKYNGGDPVRRYEKAKRHRLANPGMYAAYFKARQQRQNQALPRWANMDLIEAFYIESARITKETGIKHHVDHYYPLTSDIVCGLHNEFNLRVIPATENLSKANSFPEEIS